MKEAVIEDTNGEQLLKDGLLIENVDTLESVELLSCQCSFSADDDSGLLSVFSVLPSPVLVCCHPTAEISAFTVHSCSAVFAHILISHM